MIHTVERSIFVPRAPLVLFSFGRRESFSRTLLIVTRTPLFKPMRQCPPITRSRYSYRLIFTPSFFNPFLAPLMVLMLLSRFVMPVRRARVAAPRRAIAAAPQQRDVANKPKAEKKASIDGGAYLKEAIEDHLNTLPEAKKTELKNQIAEQDPEAFLEIPRLAVKKALSSSVSLTEETVPSFLQPHLEKLEELRQNQAKLNAQDLSNKIGAIASPLIQDADCIASMSKAMQAFSN